MRPLNSDEMLVIREIADRLPPKERDSILSDMERANVEWVSNDSSRTIFAISGYERPKYRGQHPVGVEGKVMDQDGCDLSVLLHVDENGKLLELELVRFDEGEVNAPDWNTLRLF